MSDYETYHLSCLLDMRIPAGPGDMIISLSETVFTTDGGPDHIIMLEAGTVLWVEAGAASLQEVVKRHVFSTVYSSSFRLPLGLTLGLSDRETGATTPENEAKISRWLSANTVISLRPHGSSPPPAETRQGWYNLERFETKKRRRRRSGGE